MISNTLHAINIFAVISLLFSYISLLIISYDIFMTFKYGSEKETINFMSLGIANVWLSSI